MIEISKKSWHYKLYTMYGQGEPTSLCGYFWKVITHLLFMVFNTVGSIVKSLQWYLLILTLLPIPVLSLMTGRNLFMFSARVPAVPYAPLSPLSDTLVEISIMFWCMFGAVAVVAVWIAAGLGAFLALDKTKGTNFGKLIALTVKAAWQRACPRVTLTDD